MSNKRTFSCKDRLSPFQKMVYDALLKVPKGRVTTYKLLAAAVDCGCAQAVGQALRNNPYAPSIPCHRVIMSDLSIGGFYGKNTGEAVLRKIDLLKSEGVVFDSGHLVDPNKIFNFDD